MLRPLERVRQPLRDLHVRGMRRRMEKLLMTGPTYPNWRPEHNRCKHMTEQVDGFWVTCGMPTFTFYCVEHESAKHETKQADGNPPERTRNGQ